MFDCSATHTVSGYLCYLIGEENTGKSGYDGVNISTDISNCSVVAVENTGAYGCFIHSSIGGDGVEDYFWSNDRTYFNSNSYSYFSNITSESACLAKK